MNTKIKNILTYFLVLIIMAVSFEFALRIYNSNGRNYDIEMWKYSKYLKRKSSNPLIGIEHIPLKKRILQNTLISINSRGMRDREYALPKPKDAFRIVVLGSSITLGWGVPVEDTYLKLIEKQLEGKAGNKKVEIINTSVGNYNTVREVEAFFEKYTDLSPDMIIISFFINDPQLIDVKDNFILKHSQLAVLLWSKYQQITRTMKLKTDYLHYYKNLYKNDNPGWPKCLAELERLREYCKNKNIPVLMTITPEIHNLKDYPFKEIHEIMKKQAAELNFKFLDFYAVLNNVEAKDIWAMRGDPHPNKEGHKIMAEYLYKYLMDNQPWAKP